MVSRLFENIDTQNSEYGEVVMVRKTVDDEHRLVLSTDSDSERYEYDAYEDREGWDTKKSEFYRVPQNPIKGLKEVTGT